MSIAVKIRNGDPALISFFSGINGVRLSAPGAELRGIDLPMVTMQSLTESNILIRDISRNKYTCEMTRDNVALMDQMIFSSKGKIVTTALVCFSYMFRTSDPKVGCAVHVSSERVKEKAYHFRLVRTALSTLRRLAPKSVIHAYISGGYVPQLGRHMVEMLADNRDLVKAIARELLRQKVAIEAVEIGAMYRCQELGIGNGEFGFRLL